MKIIAVSAVTAGGKTTVVNALQDRLTTTPLRGKLTTSPGGYQRVRMSMYGT